MTAPARSAAAAAVFVAALVNVRCFQPAGSDGGAGDGRASDGRDAQAERDEDAGAGDSRDAQADRPACDPARFSYAATPVVEDGGATCQFLIPDNPLGGHRIRVLADDATTVPQDQTHTTDGWDYTDETLTEFVVFGAPCAAFLAGDIRTFCVEIQFF